MSKILTEKEMVYHQRLEEVENRLSNLATCWSVPSKDSGVDEASRTSGSGLEHVTDYVGNEYASEWSCNLEKVDNLSEAYSSVAMTSSVAKCGGVELMMEREGVVDGEEERTAIMSGHHSFLEEIQRRLEQVIQVEALINEEEDCSWSRCEDESQPRLEQLAVGQVWTRPQHQNQQPGQVEQEQLLSCRSTIEVAPLPNHTITTALDSALCSDSVELEEELTGNDDKEAEEQLYQEQLRQLQQLQQEQVDQQELQHKQQVSEEVELHRERLHSGINNNSFNFSKNSAKKLGRTSGSTTTTRSTTRTSKTAAATASTATTPATSPE
jgi:hypothetical protein